MWPALDKRPLHRKHWIYIMWVQSSIVNMRTLIACPTSNVHNNRTHRTSEILVRILSGYCSSAYRTGSPTRSEFTRIISTGCDRNQAVYWSHSKAHNFAQESLIEKIKVSFWSAINVFSDGVLISVSTKCGEWVVYPERVTYVQVCVWVEKNSNYFSIYTESNSCFLPVTGHISYQNTLFTYETTTWQLTSCFSSPLLEI